MQENLKDSHNQLPDTSSMKDIKIEYSPIRTGPLKDVILKDSDENEIFPFRFSRRPRDVARMIEQDHITVSNAIGALQAYEHKQEQTISMLDALNLQYQNALFESIHGYHDVKIIIPKHPLQYDKPHTNTPISINYMEFLNHIGGYTVFIVQGERFGQYGMFGFKSGAYILAIKNGNISISSIDDEETSCPLGLTDFDIYEHSGSLILRESQGPDFSMRKSLPSLTHEDTIDNQKNTLSVLIDDAGLLLQENDTKKNILLRGFREYNPMVTPDPETLNRRKSLGMKGDTQKRTSDLLGHDK